MSDHAIEHVGLTSFLDAALEAVEPFRTPSGYRLSSDLDYVIATKP